MKKPIVPNAQKSPTRRANILLTRQVSKLLHAMGIPYEHISKKGK